MQNLDATNTKQLEIAQHISNAAKEGNTEAFEAGIQELFLNIQDRILASAESLKGNADAAILAQRGVRQLTSAEKTWYENLIDMMRQEDVKEKGHLQINRNVIINLTDLHLRLLKSPKVPFYSAAYYKALPFIVEFRTKSDGREKTELENCFDALYMTWLMKLQKREMNEETMRATSEIGKFISMLSLYFKEEEEGRLDLESEE